jgi:hypothetical protein
MVQSELDEPPAPNCPDQQYIQDIPIKFEVVRRISDAKRKIFTMKTIGGFQKGPGKLVYALTSMGLSRFRHCMRKSTS